MTRERLGRCWFALTGLVVTFGLVLQVVVAIRADEGYFTGAVARTFNVFCFFTIQSNLLVAVTCFVLAAGAVSGRRWLEVLRVDGLLGITVTFVVFHTVLSGCRTSREGPRSPTSSCTPSRRSWLWLVGSCSGLGRCSRPR